VSSLRRKVLVGACALATAAGVFFVGGKFGPKVDAGTPADKVTVAGQTLAVVGAGQSQTILSATMKTSNPEDLVFQVTSECSIVTQVFTNGTGAATAAGEVDLQAYVDSNAVPIVSIPSPQNAQKPPAPVDDGRVVFCDRVNTQNFVDSDSTTAGDELTEYQRTKQTNAFNWAAFNVGSGTHTVSVKATFCTYAAATTTQPPTCTTGASAASSCTVPGNMTNCADAIIGNRTLIVTPTSLAQNQTGP